MSEAAGKKVQIEEFPQVEDFPVSPRQAAHSHPRPKRFTRQQSFTEEEDFLPVVGSREFESSALYLDFLETFFLVAFGKIVQNLSPSTKPDAPLLGMFSEQLKKQELNPVVSKMLSRQKSKIELDISSTLRLPPDGESETATDDSDMEDERTIDEDDVVDRGVPGKGLFYVPGRGPESSDVLLNETIHGKIFDEHGYSVPPTPTPRKRPSEDFQFSGSFLHNELSKPYNNVRLNLGKKYQKHVDLLQWLSRWTERQQKLHHGVFVDQQEGSKAVLRVQLPQQLMLNSLWLLENCYYPDLFQQGLSMQGEEAIVMPTTEESTSISTSQRVHFDDADGRNPALKEDGGRRRWSAKVKDKDIPVVQAMLKPSSSSEDLTDDGRPSREVDDDMVSKMRELLSKKKGKKSRRTKDVMYQDADDQVMMKTGSKSANTKSQGNERVSDKSKRKKRQLPEVTSEHLSTAVDYEAEARRARERLCSPSALRTPSPLSTSQRLTPEPTDRDHVVGASADIIDEDHADGGHGHQERQRKQRKTKVPKKKVGFDGRGAGLESDSDSSSLNVSSLDEEEVAELEKEMVG